MRHFDAAEAKAARPPAIEPKGVYSSSAHALPIIWHSFVEKETRDNVTEFF
jgi:hypothetical protein